MELLAIQPREKIIAIDNWQQYLRDGDQFLNTAERAFAGNRKAFNFAALYNLTAMAIEKYIMAFLMQRGDLADNHTMADLVTALERHLTPEPEFCARMRLLDTFQDLCTTEQSHYVDLSREQVATIIATGRDVQRFILSHLL